MDSFGRIFRVTVFGESHGSQIGVVLDGVQPGIPLSEEDFLADIQGDQDELRSIFLEIYANSVKNVLKE